MEQISQGWSFDIEEDADGERSAERGDSKLSSALSVYEEAIQDPLNDIVLNMNSDFTGRKLEVKSQDPQVFLAAQLEALDRLRNTGDSGREGANKLKSQSETEAGDENCIVVESRVNEHIGPIQFNMGGIQVDADDMLKRLKVWIDQPQELFDP